MAYMRDLTGRRLDSSGSKFTHGSRVGFDGDSIARGISGSSGGDDFTNGVVCADSAPTYAMLASDGRWRHVINSGVPGERSDQILARQPTFLGSGIDVAVYVSPGYFNDLYQGKTIEFTLANVEAMIRGCLLANVLPIICTPTPDGTGTPTAARNVWLRTVRARVIRLCASYAIPCPDLSTPIIDPTGGTLLSAFSVDGSVHPRPAAYVKMGQAIDSALRQVIPPSASGLITDKGTGTPDLFSGAGLFYGTASGGVPGDWTFSVGSPATTPTVTTGLTDCLGNGFRVTSPSGGGNGVLYKDVASAWAVGDVLALSGLVLVSASGVKAEVQLFATGAATNARALKPISITPGSELPRSSFSKRFAVPNGTTKLTVYLSVSGGVAGYAEFSQIGLLNLSSLSLT